MNKNPILSICIPTFNRLEYLKELLEKLLPQAKMRQVEICVSDNNSTDGTHNYIEDIARQSVGHFKYYIQKQNVGIDKNMMNAISMGSGKYIYPLGDDDMLPDGSLDKLLIDMINEFDLLVLNGWHTDPDLTPVREHLSGSLAGWSTTDPVRAFTALWDKMPFGSFIARRSYFASSGAEKYNGTSHAYTGAVWDKLAETNAFQGSCIVRCTVQPTVLLRGAKKTWASNAAVIMLIEIPLWFDLVSKNKIYSEVCKEVKKEYIKNQMNSSGLLRLRIIGQLSRGNIRALTVNFSRHGKIKAAVIAFIPLSILNLISSVRMNFRLIYKHFAQ